METNATIEPHKFPVLSPVDALQAIVRHFDARELLEGPLPAAEEGCRRMCRESIEAAGVKVKDFRKGEF